MGNNDKHFRGSREQCKGFWAQVILSLDHFREQVVLLIETKG